MGEVEEGGRGPRVGSEEAGACGRVAAFGAVCLLLPLLGPGLLSYLLAHSMHFWSAQRGWYAW